MKAREASSRLQHVFPSNFQQSDTTTDEDQAKKSKEEPEQSTNTQTANDGQELTKTDVTEAVHDRSTKLTNPSTTSTSGFKTDLPDDEPAKIPDISTVKTTDTLPANTPESLSANTPDTLPPKRPATLPAKSPPISSVRTPPILPAKAPGIASTKNPAILLAKAPLMSSQKKPDTTVPATTAGGILLASSPADLGATAPKLPPARSPSSDTSFPNLPTTSLETPPKTSLTSLPVNSPVISKLDSAQFSNAKQHSVASDNVIRLINTKIHPRFQPLSKSLSALSDSLNRARSAGELKAGNFSLTSDIKNVLKNIEMLKKQADELRSGGGASENDKETLSDSQSVTSNKPSSQPVSASKPISQSTSATDHNSQRLTSPKLTDSVPFKPRTSAQILSRPSPKPLVDTEAVFGGKVNTQSKPSLAVTDQSSAKIDGQSNTAEKPTLISSITRNNELGKPVVPLNPAPLNKLKVSSLSKLNTSVHSIASSQHKASAISQDRAIAQPTNKQNSNHFKTTQSLDFSTLSKNAQNAMPSKPEKNFQDKTLLKPNISQNPRPAHPISIHHDDMTHWPDNLGIQKQTTQTSTPVRLTDGKTAQNFNIIEKKLGESPGLQQASLKSSIPDCDINLGFVLDGSASVEGTKRGNFLKMINFVKDMIHEFTQLSQQVHVGTVVYSTKAQVILRFGTKGTEEMIDRLLDNIHYPGEGSLTGNALKESWNSMFSTAPRGRKNVLLVLTDGPSNDDVHGPSKWMKDSGVEMFVIGLGIGYDEKQLKIIASTPTEKHVIIKQYDELKTSVQEVRNRLCGYTADQILQIMSNPRYYNHESQLTLNQRSFQPSQCILDVAFLLDGSRQVETNGAGNFQRQINFVKKAAKYLPLSRDDVHIGVGLLGDSEVMVFPMNEHYSENSIDYELDHIQYPASDVIQLQDLKSAREIMLRQGMRDVAPHVSVLVTDVSSLGSYRNAVDALRNEGSDLVMFGIGSYTWKQEVKVPPSVEGLVDQVVTLENSDEDEAVKQFAENLCKLSNAKRSEIPRRHWHYSHKIVND